MSRIANRFVDSRRPDLKRAMGPLLCVFILFYLGFHMVSGDRGVVALFKESRKLAALEAEFTAIAAQRQALDKKVKLLSDSSLDLDLLDEQARLVLGMAGKNEIVYFLSDEKPR
jgi:cell division protein FtsB